MRRNTGANVFAVNLMFAAAAIADDFTADPGGHFMPTSAAAVSAWPPALRPVAWFALLNESATHDPEPPVSPLDDPSPFF